MLSHACPGCGKLIPYGMPRCPKCADELSLRILSRKRSGTHYVDPKLKAFYASKAWRDMSVATLAAAMYRCQDCGGIAVEVHHEMPISTPEGWLHRFDPDHIVALCTKCHNARHGRFSTKDSTQRKSFQR